MSHRKKVKVDLFWIIFQCWNEACSQKILTAVQQAGISKLVKLNLSFFFLPAVVLSFKCREEICLFCQSSCYHGNLLMKSVSCFKQPDCASASQIAKKSITNFLKRLIP